MASKPARPATIGLDPKVIPQPQAFIDAWRPKLGRWFRHVRGPSVEPLEKIAKAMEKSGTIIRIVHGKRVVRKSEGAP